MPDEKQLSWIQQAFSVYCQEFWKYRGMKYRPNKIDGIKMMELVEMMVEPDEYIAKIRAYLGDPKWREFGGYKFKVLVDNWNAIEIKPQKDERKIAPRLIACSDCGTPHKADELCPKCYQEVK